jgi:hypothetical protein
MLKKEMSINNMYVYLKKTIVLLIISVFMGSSFIPAINSEFEKNIVNDFSENNAIVIEELKNPTLDECEIEPSFLKNQLSRSNNNWSITLYFNESNDFNDSVILGESINASDNLDIYDIFDTTTTYLDAHFTTNFSPPHNNLSTEIKKYPDDLKVWNLTVLWTIGTCTTVIISWNNTEFLNSEYDSIKLCDNNGTVLENMLTNNTYTYSCTTGPPYFYIICSKYASELINWSHRKKIKIDHTNIDNDLYNFPMLIELNNDADLASYAQDDFDDILFTDDSVNWSLDNASVRLSHEIEDYDSTNGNITVWVNVPFISSTIDTTLYMYFGNHTCGNMEGIEGTWNSSYVMIQHLNETSGIHYDSTNYDNDGINNGSNQDIIGVIDGANSFDGTDDYIRVPNNSSLQFDEGSFTAEAWIKPETVPGPGGARIINNRGTGAGGNFKGWQFKIFDSTGKWKFRDASIDDATGNYKEYESSNTYNYNEWYHVVMVYDADNELRFYVNGNLDGSVSVGSYGNISNSLPTAIGAAVANNGVEGTYSQFFDGSIDEIRVSDVARNASWVKACYINQNDPLSFYILPMYPEPNLTLVSPLNSTSAENPVDFTFIPEIYGTLIGNEQAELWFNFTTFNNGSVVYSDTNTRPQRGVIKDKKMYLIEGGGGGCKIVIRDFPNGTILQTSPVFSSASHSNTAVVIDGDMVYGQAHDGYLQAYNETTDSEIWRVHIGPGGSYSTDGNTMELYEDHLYLQSKDHIIYKININDGSETSNMSLDGGSGAKAHMLIDYENDRLYAIGQSKYYCIDLPSFSEIWNVSIVPNGGQDTRGGPILVNDSFSGEYLTIFTTYPQTYTYAVDFNGSIVWSWTTKTIRHHPAYSPNTGLIYLSDATGYTNTPVPGNLYAVYVNNGTTKWLSHGDGSSAFSRPLTISGDYLIMHTDNKASTDYMLVLSATTGDLLSSVSANSNRGYWCFPNALSGGYVATGGAYGGSEQPALDIYHIGDGDWVDYYPLHGNVNHTGYVPNGLTSLGFITEVWESRKVNDTPLVNNTLNTIGFDFSSYNLPLNFTWNILLVQSDGQYVWGDNRSVRVLPGNLSPVISNPSPANNSVNVPRSITQLSIEIADPESNLFNWSIETNPNIGSNSTTFDNNGSKTCSISGLDYNTTYIWYVNATDTGSDRLTNEKYCFTTECPPASWWNSSWLYRMSIVIDHDNVSDNLTNFPVLIDITDANLSTKAQSDGDDFVFTDYNCNLLNHEIEYYDNISGHLIVWVNVTSLSANVDTVLYMYYGNSVCGNMENVIGTWRSEFVMVHHLDETSGTHYDSTSYGNNGTAQSSVDQNVTGKINGADEFDDTANAFVDVGVNSSMDIYSPNSDFSILLWIKRNNTSSMDGFFSSGSSSSNGIYFGTKYSDENDLKFMSPDSTVAVTSNVDCIGDNDWHLVGVTADRDGNMDFWVDGVSVVSQSILGTNGENWNRVDDRYKIGTDRAEGSPMDGLLDEVWVYNGLLSIDWISTCYENQNDPTNFCFTGSEEIYNPIKYYNIPLNDNWNLISMPFNESVDKSDIMVSYNGSNFTWQQAVDNGTVLNFVYGWNASIQTYYSAITLEPGFGYWMWSNDGCKLLLSSNKSEDSFITDLKLSWNIMGLRSNSLLLKTNLIINYNGTDYNWYEATTNNNPEGEPLILGFFYTWDKIMQNYVLSDEFNPGFGYWMYAFYECILKES